MKERQGTSDGLCGIYAMAAIMHHAGVGHDDFRGTIVELLKGLSSELLTPDRIGSEGFKPTHLLEALHRSQRKGLPILEARSFARSKNRLEIMGLGNAFDAGAMVLSQDRKMPGHWVAVLGQRTDGKFSVYDPYPKNRREHFSEKKLWERAKLLIGLADFWTAFEESQNRQSG